MAIRLLIILMLSTLGLNAQVSLYVLRADSVSMTGKLHAADLFLSSYEGLKTRLGVSTIDTSSLSLRIDGKAALAHTHVKSDITDFAHIHNIADITNLQSTLDGKAPLAHSHIIGDITNLQTTLDGKAALSHTHAESDITNLVTDLAAKQNASNAVVTDADQTITSLKTFSPATGDFARFGSSAAFSLGTGSNPRLYTRTSTLLILDASLGVQIGKNTNANYVNGWVNIFGNDATKAIATFNTSAGVNIASIDATGQPIFSTIATGASTDAPMVYNATDKKLKQVSQLAQSQVTNLTSDLASKQGTLTLTTTGTSGAATLIGNTLNIPNYPGGTVTSVSVASANGFSGSVATSTTTPAITLGTTVTGLVKGNGSALSAAVAGTDYAAASHTHAESDVTNLTTDLAAKQGNIQWQSQGTNTGTGGAATTVNVSGYGMSSSVSGSTNTINFSGFDMLRAAPVVNEFYSSSGLYSIGSNATGTGASWGATTGAVDHPGIGQYTTGTTATGRVYVATGTTPILFGNNTWETGGIVRTGTLSTSAERYTYILGFADVVTADNQVDGAYFLYDEGGVSTGSAASANWQCVTTSNSARTFTTTSVAVNASQWYKLQIKVNADATSVDFIIDGTTVATHTTNIPSGAGRNTGWVGMMGKSVGTTSRTFDIDYMYLVGGPFTTTR